MLRSGTTKKTPATYFLQEHSGYVMMDRMKALAARCATCGPLSAVAGYTMEHWLINKTFGSDSQVKALLEGEPVILQSTDLSPTASSWTATDGGKRRLSNSRSESALLTARYTGATSSTSWNQGYQGQRYQGQWHQSYGSQSGWWIMVYSFCFFLSLGLPNTDWNV